MDRNDVLAKIRTIEPVLRARGVGALYLFGSYGRDDARHASDIDIFVDAGSEAFYDMSNFVGAYSVLRDAFPGTDIGFTTRDGLSGYVRSSVEQEAVQIF